MDSAKYIGLDVHKESISIAVLNAAGKIVMEGVIETNATLILQFFRGLRGELHVTFEEGTSAAWLYDLIQPHVTEVVVCNPRQNALLKVGNNSDRISFLEFLSQKSQQLGEGLNLGAFDRLEMEGDQTRVVAQVKLDRGIFLRATKGSARNGH